MLAGLAGWMSKLSTVTTRAAMGLKRMWDKTDRVACEGGMGENGSVQPEVTYWCRFGGLTLRE